jgi:hypothetical protein
MRATYRVLALLIAAAVVVQAAVIAAAWFTVLHDTDSGAVFDKNSQGNWGNVAHSVIGTGVIPILAILLLIISFFAKIPGGVRWAAITFGVVVLQILFAFLGFGVPVLGTLHGINAFVLAAVASLAARQARVAETASPVEAASPVATV